jgi:hypothetical protein
VPGSYTFADNGHRPLLAMAQTPSAYWSRPIHADVCSMFARMPWYAPAPSGTRSATRMRVTGQNGSSRHVVASFDSSSRIISEQSSGLLIRGFGVQVPGGASVLTWPYSLLAIRLSLSWGMDGAFLGHARVSRLMTAGSRRGPGCLVPTKLSCANSHLAAAGRGHSARDVGHT